MKIEAGKYYKMRNGGKAFVDHLWGIDPFTGEMATDYPVRGFRDGLGYTTWNEDGRFNGSDGCGYDLVEEWREPVTKEVTVYLRQDKEHREIWAAIDCVECGNFKTIGSAKVTLTEGKFA